MKIKRFCAVLIVLCMMLMPFALPASAADILIYKVGENGYLGLNRYTGALEKAANIEGDLVIPSSIEGVEVTSIADSTFYGYEYLESVYVPSSIISIGDRAFSACTRLTDVTISEGTVSIGKSAFQYCYSLKNVQFPTTLTAIQDYTFSHCIALETMSVPSGVKSIGSYAFEKCSLLTSISLPSGITSIGDYAFDKCTSLASVNLPYGLTEISIALFNECTALSSVTVPSTVQSVGKSAFGQCTSLEQLVLPEGVTKIYDWAFDRCTNLKEISMPDSIVSIAADSFYGCDNMTFRVNAGSYSQVFASANDIPFVLGTSSSTGGSNTGGSTPFTDIENHWAKDSIIWAYENSLFGGTSATTFSPNGVVNRAMFVTVLYRMEGEPAVSSQLTYSDTRSDAYYAKAVIWATENSIVGGVGNNKFSPLGNMTREQFATMLYRYAAYKGKDVSKVSSLAAYPDAAQVSKFAAVPMQWAVGTQIIGGKGGMLVPRGNTTRAEAATMMQRYNLLVA